MLKNLPRLSVIVSVALVGAIVLVAATVLIVRSNNASTIKSYSAPKQSTNATVTIPRAQELFSPFIQTIAPNSTVIWQNNDTVEHTITTTWDHSTFLNAESFSMTVEAGQSVKYTFTKPGLYHYFDNTQAKWDKTLNRVLANKGVPNYPLAMDGVIWVQGPVSGLSVTENNSIPNGQDDFVNEFLAIPQGGTISWHNQDTDGHTLAPVIGWSAPVNPVLMALTQINGTSAVPHGETKTLTFTRPGLYYYYCPNHATVNTKWNRAQAHSDASAYPIPMEGFVLVAGK